MTRTVLRAGTVTVALLAFGPSSAVRAQVGPAAGGAVTVEAARQLTWKVETRPAGILALRRLSATGPDAEGARVELGRVLTWDPSTRAEGITLLREATTSGEGLAAAEEALGEVLTWESSTRAEGVSRLRRLRERQPTRISTQLKLADALSWSADTRDEAEALYRAVLRADATSVDATVGLARVLSWTGRFAESRETYRQALTRDPAGSAALVGLAQLDGWTGQARASLSRLERGSGSALETPDAYQARAEAYSQIGRPASARRAYRDLLGVRPTDEHARRALQQIDRTLRPTLEIGGDSSDQSGDATRNKVTSTVIPVRLRFHPAGSDAALTVSASMASFENARGTSQDRMVGLGVDTPLGNRWRIVGDATRHQFDRAGATMTGRGEVLFAPHDRVELRLGGAREPLYSSRMSLAGEDRDGVFYGPSFSTELLAGLTVHPTRRWDLWVRSMRGRTRGAHLLDNDHSKAFAGIGRSIAVGPSTVRVGYALAWMAYRLDLGGFPPADLAGNGETSRGVGGYFSPYGFSNHAARVDVTLPLADVAMIVGGTGVGRQSVRDALTRGKDSRSSSDAYLGFRVFAGSRLSVSGQIDHQNVASAFNRTTARLTLGVGF